MAGPVCQFILRYLFSYPDMGQVHTHVPCSYGRKGQDYLKEASVTYEKGSSVTPLGYRDEASVSIDFSEFPCRVGLAKPSATRLSGRGPSALVGLSGQLSRDIGWSNTLTCGQGGSRKAMPHL